MGGDDDHFKKAIAEILSLLRKPDVQVGAYIALQTVFLHNTS